MVISLGSSSSPLHLVLLQACSKSVENKGVFVTNMDEYRAAVDNLNEEIALQIKAFWDLAIELALQKPVEK